MEEAWERAVQAKLEGLATPSSELRVLNLDGAVKSLHGCLPPAGLLERFPGLEHLSIANVGAASLERFPRLRNLQRLILSDNRIAGGLESLVDAGLQSLRDLDLSNNRIQQIEDLTPLASLHLVSLDLYECPVTRVKDYRSKVFSMIRTLKYLDKLDANENERPETDDEEEEEDEEYDDDEEDSGSGEVDGGDPTGKLISGSGMANVGDEGIVDADEDEGSDADEEEIETNGRKTGSGFSGGSGHHLSNGFRVTATGAAFVDGDEHDGDEDDDDVEDDDGDDDLGEEIDEDEADYEDDVAEMHNVLDSDEEDEDGVDEIDIDEEEIDEDGDDDEDVDEYDDEIGVGDEKEAEPGSTGRLASTEGEIDGHDHGEEDENGEIGEADEQGVDDRDVEEEDYGESEDEDDLDGEYLVQPIARSSLPDSSVGNEEDDIDYEDENRPNNDTLNQTTTSSSDPNKRRRDEGHLDDDKTEELKPSKRR